MRVRKTAFYPVNKLTYYGDFRHDDGPQNRSPLSLAPQWVRFAISLVLGPKTAVFSHPEFFPSIFPRPAQRGAPRNGAMSSARFPCYLLPHSRDSSWPRITGNDRGRRRSPEISFDPQVHADSRRWTAFQSAPSESRGTEGQGIVNTAVAGRLAPWQVMVSTVVEVCPCGAHPDIRSAASTVMTVASKSLVTS